MASDCLDYDGFSGHSSADGFGWKVAKISIEKELMLINDVRMALSELSNVSSSESSDSEADPRIIQDEYISVDSVSRRKNGSKTVMPNVISNIFAGSFCDEQHLRSALPVEVSGDNAMTPKQFVVQKSSKYEVQNSCIVSSSYGTPLQPQEVVGLDLNHFAADSSEPALFCEDLTADEEVWLLQCPNNVNLHTLKEKMLLSPASSKITVGQGHVLEASSHSQCPQALTFVLPSRVDRNCRVVLLKPAGQIIIREHVDIPRMTVPELTKKKVKFPVGLKMRHPLLGADYEKDLETYNESMKRLSSHRKRKKEKKWKRNNFFEKCNNMENYEKINKHKKNKLFTEKTCQNTLIYSGIPVTSEDFQSISNPTVSKQKKEEFSSIGSTQFLNNTEESNVELNECFPKYRNKNNSEVEKSLALQENNREHRKRKREGTKCTFETSAELSEEEHEINIKKKKHEKKRRKLDINVDKNPKDDLVIIEKNIQSVAHLETCKRNVAEIHKHTTDMIKPNENSTTNSFGDFTRIEKKMKKKKKRRVSDEEGANTHHSVIGISVDVEKRNKYEKDRTYRFTIPADFGMKNKSASHRRKISVDVNL